MRKRFGKMMAALGTALMIGAAGLVSAPAAQAAGSQQKILWAEAASYESVIFTPSQKVVKKVAATGAEGRTVSLQRYSGGKWRTVATGKVRNMIASIRIPIMTAASSNYSYRYMLPAKGQEKSVASKTFKLRTENPSKYKGYEKRAYDAMKKWCPGVGVDIVSNRTWRKQYRGQAYLLTGAVGHVKIASGLSRQYLDYAAKHECAHIRQWVKAKDSMPAWYNIGATTKRTFKAPNSTMAFELQADCMSKAMGVNIARLGAYKRSCTPAQLASARKVLSGRL